MKDHKQPGRLRQRVSAMWDHLQRKVHRDVEAATEPIDFSAPSIAYYSGLAERFSLTRTILYVVLFLFVVGTILVNARLITYENLYYLAKDINAAALTAQAPSDYISYPVSTNEPDFALYRNGLVIAGGEEVTALSASGKTTLSANVSYADPCVRSSEAYFLTFGRGERTFQVYNAFVQVYAEDTKYPVYDAYMADSGDFAVVTRSREYKSEVAMYSHDLQKVSAYRTDRYVTGVSMTSDGDRVAMVSTAVENGVPYSTLQIVRPGKDEVDADVRLDGVVLYQCTFLTDNRIAVLGDGGAWIYAVNGEQVARLSPGGTCVLGTVDQDSQRLIFLVRNDRNFSEYDVKVFDRSGKLEHAVSVSLTTEALDLFGQDKEVYLRTPDEIIRVSLRQGTVERLTVPGNVQAAKVLKDGSLLVCTSSYAYRPAQEDWIMD